MIAIDTNLRLVYEGESNSGHAVWPSPFIAVACVIKLDEDFDHIQGGSDPARAKLVFREDSFDPVTRIRRGRFYSNPGMTQPQDWYVQPHQAYPAETGQKDTFGRIYKRLYGFREWPAAEPLNERGVYVALGFKEAYTLWRVISVERAITGDDLVTLQARSTFGTISEIDLDKIPRDDSVRVAAAYSATIDAAFRAGPLSVIDRCRDVAQILLSSWISQKNNTINWPAFDLSELAKRLQDLTDPKPRMIAINAAFMIARLHARGKPNVQKEHSVSGIVEDDALLSLQCLSAIVRELGYAKA